MAELTREEFLAAWDKQQEQATLHNRDQLSAINGLASEIRAMADAIVTRQGKREPGNFTLLFGIIGVICGLMSPMYFMVQGVKEDVVMAQERMHEDYDRKRDDAEVLGSIKQRISHLENLK